MAHPPSLPESPGAGEGGGGIPLTVKPAQHPIATTLLHKNNHRTPGEHKHRHFLLLVSPRTGWAVLLTRAGSLVSGRSAEGQPVQEASAGMAQLHSLASSRRLVWACSHELAGDEGGEGSRHVFCTFWAFIQGSQPISHSKLRVPDSEWVEAARLHSEGHRCTALPRGAISDINLFPCLKEKKAGRGGNSQGGSRSGLREAISTVMLGRKGRGWSPGDGSLPCQKADEPNTDRMAHSGLRHACRQ